MEMEEKGSWMNNRKIKLDTAMNTLKNKQNLEMNNLQKRVMTGID